MHGDGSAATHTSASAGLHRMRVLFLALALLAAGAARAQTFTASLGALSSASGARPELTLALSGGRVGSATVSLELALRDAAQLGFSLSENRSFGPLGNVVFGFDLDIRTDASAQAELAARGVIGPVALRLALGAFSHDAGRFDPAAYATGVRPQLRGAGGGEGGFSVRLGGSGRLNRSLVLEAEPELYLVGGGAVVRLETRLRWLRAFGDNELRLLARAFSAPVMDEGHVGLGVGVVLGRGRAPDWTFTASLGYADGMLLPGATAELVERFAGGQVVAVMVAAEPYRRDVAPYRARASLEAGLGPGTTTLAGQAALGGVDMARPVLSLSVGYTLPVDLR